MLGPSRDFVGVGLRVARHDRAVGIAHDKGRIVGAAVGIDQQPREGRENRRRREPARQRARKRGRADVVGDMPLQRRARQTERRIRAEWCSTRGRRRSDARVERPRDGLDRRERRLDRRAIRGRSSVHCRGLL